MQCYGLRRSINCHPSTKYVQFQEENVPTHCAFQIACGFVPYIDLETFS